MPTILRIGAARLFFFSNEGREPPHIHVETTGSVARFWLDPVSLATSSRFRRQELRRLERGVVEPQQELLEAWREFFEA